MTAPKNASSVIMITVAITRGRTSTSMGDMPIEAMASTSSFSFIEPICAANADPERPATMIAVSRMPSSRITERPIKLTTNTSAPNCASWTAPCCASTMPTRNDSRPTMPKRVRADHLHLVDDGVPAQRPAAEDRAREDDKRLAEEAQEPT